MITEAVKIKKTPEQELKMLRSFAISMVGQDPEGEYKPSFVRGVLSAMKEKPTHEFTTPEKFLEDVKNA